MDFIPLPQQGTDIPVDCLLTLMKRYRERSPDTLPAAFFLSLADRLRGSISAALQSTNSVPS